MENMENVAQNITETISSLGKIDLSGCKLEEAKPELLDINSLTLDLHVAMQPAALAYYGQLRKDAMRRLTDLKSKRERWEKSKYAEAKAACLRDMPKATVADIEARVVNDNAAEFKKLDEIERNAQAVFDTFDVWYEAWKQKGYTLREHISMEIGERSNANSSIVFDEPTDSVPPKPLNIPATGDSLEKLAKKFGGKDVKSC